MLNTSGLFSTFGDVIALSHEIWNCKRIQDILLTHDGWKQYNPRKMNNRFGLSVTSLDGEYSGVPDLDSLLEYNKENGTNHSEHNFTKRTPIVDDIPELKTLLDMFSPLGRCHFLRINSGGFFPPHRDNGSSIPSPTFRVIVPIANTSHHQWKWIHEDKLITLETGRAYCINTSKEHSVFSFVDDCIILVMNVPASAYNCLKISSNLLIK